MSDEGKPALNRFNADRVSEPRPGGGSRYTFVPDQPRPPAPSRTESSMERNLIVHYRKIVGEESQALLALYAELEKLRKDPRVVRYLEATAEYEQATERREQAARDLGMVICRELGEVKP